MVIPILKKAVRETVIIVNILGELSSIGINHCQGSVSQTCFHITDFWFVWQSVL
jgi:hypothetical protein